MDEIRLGIIGSGFMGRTNAETITKYLPGVRLIAIAGGSRAQQLASDYGVECDQDVECLVNRDDIDGVFISTPHSEHAKHTIAAANARKHVLLDKPMAASVEECDQILDATRRTNVNLMIMFGQRFRLVEI